MTSRLLQRSLGSPDYDGIRQALRDDTSTPVLSVRGLEVRVSVLPLFTHDGRQAIRVSSTEPLTHSLVGVDSAAGRDVTLLVPEVTAPRVLTLECRDEAGPGDGVVGSAQITVTPQRKWSVFVVHHSHLDIGYTDPQGTVLRHHLDYLDAAVRLAEETASWPDDAKFRWTVESSMPALRWLDARPAEMVEAFARRAREGVIEVTALPFQLHTEACSTEELHRQLRFTSQLHDRYGFTTRSAMHTDVPGAVVGLIDALSAAGVRYLAAAHNWAGRSVPYLHGGDKLTRPFRWRAPSGNEIVVWFTDTPHGMAYMEGNTVGLTDSYELADDLLPRYLSALATRGYPYGPGTFGWQGPDAPREPYELDALHLRVQGAHADNAGPSIVPASIARKWNEQWAYPRLRSAVNSDFFDHVVERYHDRLAVHEGDWTDWWADGLGSGARPLGYVRRAQSALRVAETLHTLAGVDATEEIDAAYDKVALFNEHTWGAANPWEDAEEAGDSGGLQWTRKSSGAYDAQDDAADLLHAATRRYAAALSDSDPAEAEGRGLAAFAVFNPGTRARTDVVRAFLPRDVVAVDVPVALVDARTGETLPHHEELVDPVDWPTRPIGRHLHAVVPDVPGHGYARLDVVPCEVQAPEPVELGLRSSPGAGVIENEFYRVSYDVREGYIGSVFDKRAGRELVDADAAAGFGQYVYDQYATAPHFNHLSGHVGAHDRTLLGDRDIGRNATIVAAQRTAVGEKLVVELRGKGVDWLRTTIELHNGVPRLDLTYQLAKQGTPAKEAVFLAFPFAAGPATAWELTGGVGGPDVPRVPGSAEYMLPIRHWIAFEDPELTIAWATLEAPLVQLGTIHMPYAPFPPTLDQEDGTVYSWALNNIWDTNFPSQQQGETTFRYSVMSARAGGRRLGAAVASGLTEPFVGALITGSPGATETYVSVDHPDVLLTSIGRSGDERVVRLQSLAAEPVEVTVTMPGLRAARELDVVDESVKVRVPACGVATVWGTCFEDR
ncbi:hypothetical protein ITP53_23480 [Nonomuraea sp. K274]|uniref:Glycoside hydrolase family 38 N-terminal domain-containing protein n=1 Tax=Nonomuraea cypriaca TaxID=1187855 RepID=A0A931AEJ6_9ACTN|nr:glycoside hydrolase family 38 C-terminal domain-containing protein [Nonomuraea cypriaca]MBF8188635.1 hypothetical protein [Nonomuraea cypriaca]